MMRVILVHSCAAHLSLVFHSSLASAKRADTRARRLCIKTADVAYGKRRERIVDIVSSGNGHIYSYRKFPVCIHVKMSVTVLVLYVFGGVFGISLNTEAQKHGTGVAYGSARLFIVRVIYANPICA